MEIINVHTPRGLVLKGAMWGDNTMNTVVIMMSGICSNVFQNELLPATGKLLSENEIAFIAGQAMDAFSFISYSNTVTKTQTTTGVVNDDFSQVYEDVDSYVKYAKELGFKKIILAGHSLGSNKIINYLANTPDDFVDSYIVTAPIDLAHFFDCIKDKKMYLETAQKFVEEGRGSSILPFLFMGFSPMCAKTLLYFPSEKSKNCIPLYAIIFFPSTIWLNFSLFLLALSYRNNRKRLTHITSHLLTISTMNIQKILSPFNKRLLRFTNLEYGCYTSHLIITVP